MIRILLALVMLVGLGREAFAQDAATPRLKELVTVSSEIVRIGDLIENAGPSANIAVFRAPDLGQTGAVPVARIAEALRPYEVTGIDTGGLTEVVVTRLSRALTGKDIADRIARAVSGQFGYGDPQNLAVILDRDFRILHVEFAVTSDLMVSRMYVDPRTGRFDISFELPGSALPRRVPLRFTGTITDTVEAATLTRSLKAGEIVKVSDVAIERRPKAELRGDGMPTGEVVGLAARAALRSGQALRTDDLIKPQIVQRNESVTIMYEVPGVALTVRGKALEAGAMGDVVSVLNIQSNRTVQATIIGPGRVTIAAPRPLVAAAAAPATTEVASDDSESSRTQ